MQSQTEREQAAIDNVYKQHTAKAQQMGALASGMNAMSNYADVQHKLSPAYLEAQKAQTAAELARAQATQSQADAAHEAAQVDAFNARVKVWYLGGKQGPRPEFNGTPTTPPTLEVPTDTNTPPTAPSTTESSIMAQGVTTPLDSAISTYTDVNMFPDLKGMMTAENDQSNVNYIRKNFKPPSANASNVDWFNHKKEINQFLSSKGITDKVDRNRITDQYLGGYDRTAQDSLNAARDTDLLDNVRTAVYSSNSEDFKHLTRADYAKVLGPDEGGKQFDANQNKVYQEAVQSAGQVAFTHPNEDNKIAPKNVQHRNAYAKFKQFSSSIAELPKASREALETRYFAENESGMDKAEITSLQNARTRDQEVYTKQVMDTFNDPNTNFSSANMKSMLANLVKHGQYDSIPEAFAVMEGKFVTQIVKNIEEAHKNPGETTDQFADRIISSQFLQDAITGYATEIGLGEKGTNSIVNLVDTKLNVAKKEKNYTARLANSEKALADFDALIEKSKKTHSADNMNKALLSNFISQGGEGDPTGAQGQLADVFNRVIGYNPELVHNPHIFYKLIRKYNPGVDLDLTDSASDLEIGSMQANPGHLKDYSMEGNNNNAGKNTDLFERISNTKKLYAADGDLTKEGIALAEELLMNKTAPGVLAKNNLFRTDEEKEQVKLLRLLTKYQLNKQQDKRDPLKKEIRDIRNKLIAK